MTDSSKTPPPTGGVDPITGFWRDMWARSSAQGQSPVPGMPPMPNMPGMDPAAFLNPEAMKRMQSAFFESMAQYAEQSMRSPQFLEAMKRSMDQAMRFRQQMDDFLQSNMASAFDAATGGANAEVLGAIRLLSKQVDAKLSDLSERVARLESGRPAKPAKATAKATGKPAASKKTSKRGAKR